MIKKSILILSVLGLLLIFPLLNQAADWIILSGLDFIPRTHNGEWWKNTTGVYLNITGGSHANDRDYFTPVRFPASAQGKYVTRMSVSLYDNSATGYMFAELQKVDLYTGTPYGVYYVSTFPSSSTPGKVLLHDDTGTKKKIDNGRWAWYLWIWFSEIPSPNDALRLYSVRIKYE